MRKMKIVLATVFLLALLFTIPIVIWKIGKRPVDTKPASCVRPAYSFPKIDIQENRIVGGDDAKRHQFPYLVSLQEDGYPICGGAIIDASYILTAAHCVTELTTSNALVLAGILCQSDTNLVAPEKQKAPVSKIIIHEAYNYINHRNDIALLKLSKPLRFGVSVKPIPYAHFSEKDLIAAGSPVVASGWGDLSYRGEQPDVLQFVVLQTMTNKHCRNRGINVADDEMCAFAPGKDSCQGDSGGPLVATFAGGMKKVVGVVSRGIECSHMDGYPSIYTKVAKYSYWIAQKMSE